jgi:diguanylate cyclase (GGDEF)-like protein
MRRSRTISLRAFITIPFLGLFLAAGVSISLISYHSAQNATERLARQLVAEVGARIESHLQHFFTTPSTVVKLNAEAMRSGRLQAQDISGQMRLFADQVRTLPYLTFVSFSAVDGQYIAATRPPRIDAAPELITALVEDDLALRVHAIDAAGEAQPPHTTGSRYDARERPYYQLAAQRAAPFWYPVNRYRAYDSLGVGMAAPLRDRDGRLLGVFAADLALVQIGRYLQSLPVGRAGLAFVVERNGDLLASSTSDPVFRLHGEAFSRISIVDHPEPLLRAAGGLVGGLRANAGGQHVIESAGERYLLDLRRFGDPHGLELLIGVLLPESEFTAVVEHGAWQALLLTLTAVAVGAGIGLLLTRWIASPVELISAHASRLALGELEQRERPDTPIREIIALSTSFEKMATDLRELIDRLEMRVAERTAALEQVNRELERLSALDGLTRVANRRAFDETLQREWERARRSGATLALLLADVDRFKDYNDHYGHQQGDQALRVVAGCLASGARRPADLAARYGGEEFAMILPDTDLAGAARVAEAVRAAVREAGLERGDAPPADRITISIGVACAIPGADGSMHALVGAADQALYRAKAEGRDRVVTAS